MTIDDKELKAAERRGYSKGYVAGKKRKERNISEETRQRKKDVFWQRAFVAALPAAFAAQGWSRGETPITSLKERVRLAAETADEALSYAFLHL